uniref:ubiquitinyl hydrolase 1 n=1 Tax=Timema poppense TaxID=170557 RepID=A0A7R9D4N0_TIMPO|nr:unnamed protein product [Timema poppensis]
MSMLPARYQHDLHCHPQNKCNTQHDFTITNSAAAAEYLCYKLVSLHCLHCPNYAESWKKFKECSLSDVLENCPEGVDAHSKKRRLEDYPEVEEVLSKATGPQTEDCPRVLEIHSDTTGLRTSSLFHTKVFCSTSNFEMRRRLASSSVLPSPFQGLLTSQLVCTQCGYKSAVHYDKFDSLPLSLPAGLMTLKPTSLVYLLESFVATELVRGVKCEGCKEPHSSVLKSLNFGKLPQCLCFHISRTTWQDSGHAYKRHDLIEFPQLLCMEPYLYPHCRGEQQSMFPLKKPRQEPVFSTSLRLKHWYQLVAVVVHIGDAHSGHFATYRRVTSKLSSRATTTLMRDSDTIYFLIALMRAKSTLQESHRAQVQNSEP